MTGFLFLKMFAGKHSVLVKNPIMRWNLAYQLVWCFIVFHVVLHLLSTFLGFIALSGSQADKSVFPAFSGFLGYSI